MSAMPPVESHYHEQPGQVRRSFQALYHGRRRPGVNRVIYQRTRKTGPTGPFRATSGLSRKLLIKGLAQSAELVHHPAASR
jgi:hypothetical protein